MTPDNQMTQTKTYQCGSTGSYFSRNLSQTKKELIKEHGITDIVNGKFFKGLRLKEHRVLYITKRPDGEYQFVVNFYTEVSK
jgi:hypothetical protein